MRGFMQSSVCRPAHPCKLLRETRVCSAAVDAGRRNPSRKQISFRQVDATRSCVNRKRTHQPGETIGECGWTACGCNCFRVMRLERVCGDDRCRKAKQGPSRGVEIALERGPILHDPDRHIE